MRKEERSFINGSILPALLRFAFPVLLALFLQDRKSVREKRKKLVLSSEAVSVCLR